MKNLLCTVLAFFLCISHAYAQTAIWASTDRSAITTSMRLPVDTSASSTPGHLKVEPANVNGIYFNSGGHLFAGGLLFDSAGSLFLSGAAQYCDENGANCADIANVMQNLTDDSSPQLSANLDGQNNLFNNVGAIRYQSSRNQPACTTAIEGTIFYNSSTNIFNFCDDSGITQIFSTGGVGLANIVEDVTPQLGANLDLNTFEITGLVIGTDVQAFDAVLEDLAAVAVIADNEFIVGTGAGTYANESGATLLTSIGADPIGTDNSTDVTLSGAGAYLGLTGQDIQVDLIVWSDDHATGTDGQIPTFDANGEPAFVATGTNDQFLLSNGAGAASTFQSVGSDGQVIFNSSGSLISESDFKYDEDSNTLTLTGPLIDTSDMPAARTADHTFALSDLGAYIRYDSSGSLSATVPPNSSVAFPIGQMLFGQIFDGTNTLTLVAGAGVTIETPTSLVYTSGSFGLKKTATDVWTAIGGD